jgi:uncharacterized protein (UPF0335 family)
MGKAEEMSEKALTIRDDNGDYLISEKEYSDLSDYAEELESYAEKLENEKTLLVAELKKAYNEIEKHSYDADNFNIVVDFSDVRHEFKKFIKIDCPQCKGKGLKYNGECSKCHGTGQY